MQQLADKHIIDKLNCQDLITFLRAANTMDINNNVTEELIKETK
jgi:hypothetical protein